MNTLPRVVVVDDHALLAEGFRRSWQGKAEILGVAQTAPSGVAMAIEHEPDVVTMDVNLPGSPWDAIEAIRGRTKAKVLVITGGTSAKIVDAAKASGASGIVEKGLMADEILSAVYEVAKGGTVWGATWEARKKALDHGAPAQSAIGDDDLYLVQELAIGKTVQDLALEWDWDECEVYELYDRLREKYDAATDAQLVAIAMHDQYAQLNL